MIRPKPMSCRIQLLSPRSSLPGTQETVGLLWSCQDGRLVFTAGHAFSAAGAVSLEYDDVLFVGEVLACEQEDVDWKVLLQIRHQWNGLQSLLNLRDHLLGASSASASEDSRGTVSVLAA